MVRVHEVVKSKFVQVCETERCENKRYLEDTSITP